jgi:hypothetical protein
MIVKKCSITSVTNIQEEKMKVTRFLSFLIMVVLVATVLVPAPVYAASGSVAASVPTAKDKTGTLTVNNTSGGTLFISLSGPRSYYFVTSASGKTRFTNIEPGTYTITLSATTCADVLTITKKINGKVTLNKTVCEQKHSGKDKKAAKVSSLKVDNRTGGALYISLSGERSYSFSTYTQGVTIFNDIQGGRYTITVTASACGGSLSYTKNFNGRVSLKPFICH